MFSLTTVSILIFSFIISRRPNSRVNEVYCYKRIKADNSYEKHGLGVSSDFSCHFTSKGCKVKEGTNW